MEHRSSEEVGRMSGSEISHLLSSLKVRGILPCLEETTFGICSEADGSNVQTDILFLLDTLYLCQYITLRP
jgi:hypothetical protein